MSAELLNAEDKLLNAIRVTVELREAARAYTRASDAVDRAPGSKQDMYLLVVAAHGLEKAAVAYAKEVSRA